MEEMFKSNDYYQRDIMHKQQIEILKQQTKIQKEQVTILRRQNYFNELLTIATLILAISAFLQVFGITLSYDNIIIKPIITFVIALMVICVLWIIIRVIILFVISFFPK
jgi:hypothetical protein